MNPLDLLPFSPWWLLAPIPFAFWFVVSQMVQMERVAQAQDRYKGTVWEHSGAYLISRALGQPEAEVAAWLGGDQDAPMPPRWQQPSTKGAERGP